jgi:hypothetical protein
MKTQRLSIAEIQIYFDAGGVALFSAGEKQRAAVELDLEGYRDFIDRWLQVSDEVRPRVVTQEERQLRSFLKVAAKGFKRHVDNDAVELILREAAQRRPESASLTAAQLEEAVADAISSL